MVELTSYSPVRIFLSGVFRVLFSAPPFLVAGVFVAILLHPPKAAPTASDPPIWALGLIGLLFFVVGLSMLTGGIGRMISAFSRKCCFRTGPEGIVLRFPVRGWFGRYTVPEWKLRWDDVVQIYDFVYKINGIPTSSELRLRLRDGKTIKIPREYFAASPAVLAQHLPAMRPQKAA